ncbi:hypothetical protein C8R44DRAFT_726464 [Mycena epipterygia]|nr:hypothetical protein C8R44DRAFT_726464 [Mycena epipterygia]
MVSPADSPRPSIYLDEVEGRDEIDLKHDHDEIDLRRWAAWTEKAMGWVIIRTNATYTVLGERLRGTTWPIWRGRLARHLVGYCAVIQYLNSSRCNPGARRHLARKKYRAPNSPYTADANRIQQALKKSVSLAARSRYIATDAVGTLARDQTPGDPPTACNFGARRNVCVRAGQVEGDFARRVMLLILAAFNCGRGRCVVDARSTNARRGKRQVEGVAVEVSIDRTGGHHTTSLVLNLEIWRLEKRRCHARELGAALVVLLPGLGDGDVYPGLGVSSGQK